MARIARDEMFIEIANIVAKRGTCPRAQVGAVLVNGFNKIRSIGYNGSPPKEDHCEDVGCRMVDSHCVRTIHAEENVLEHIYGIKSLVKGTKDHTLYVTHKPCSKCTKKILDLSDYIGRVVFDVPYRYDGPVQWEQGGILFEQYNPVHS